MRKTLIEAAQKKYNTHAVETVDDSNIEPHDAITDLNINTKNRNETIKEYGYGPANPLVDEPKFWADKADLWGTTVEHAKTMRCGNCAAFDQSKATVKKIADAIGDNGTKVAKLADLGFCEFFWFKCAAQRTCDGWVSGGPIK